MTATDQPEHLLGSVERLTFHSEQTGFAVLRLKVRGQRELATVAGSAARIRSGEQSASIGHRSREARTYCPCFLTDDRASAAPEKLIDR